MGKKVRAIHIWVPDIRDGSGGIQAFSRFFVEAVCRLYPTVPIRVLVKNDKPMSDDPLRSLPITFHSVHKIPALLRTLVFVVRGIWLGLIDRPTMTLTTHVHFLPALTLLRRLCGTRCAAVLHGIEAWNLSGHSRIHALQRANRLMAVSRFTREEVVRRFGIEPDSMDIISNTFDAARFTPGPKPSHLLAQFGLRPDQPILLTVSRLALSESYKGHRQVLHALTLVRKAFPDVRYIVGGEGDDLPRFKEAVKALHLEENVILAGHVPGPMLPDYYRLCDAFVMPSSREGFGIVFLEAMSTGRPVIAGKVDGSVDALDGGRLGTLVDPFNISEIADAVVAVLQRREPDKLMLQPQRLHEEVTKLFGYKQFERRLETAMKKLGDGASSPGSPDEMSPCPDIAQRVPCIVVVTQLTSPYQVELFNEIAAQGHCGIEVIYLTSRDAGRLWPRPQIAHTYLILDEDRAWEKAERLVMNADLVVFNYYLNTFCLRSMRRRERAGKRWIFWGERLGVLNLAVLGPWFRRFALRPLHKSAAPIWGIGKFAVEGYKKEFGDKRPYRDIPYFSNLSRFRDKTSAVPLVRKRVFLFSGTLNHRKGADIMARAFVKIARGRGDVHLIVMGEGPLKGLMKEILCAVEADVTWTGFRQWDELPPFFNKANILCAPSRHDGWGLVVAQGLAAGLPVISTSRTGAALEFVRVQENGWICPPDDTEAVACAMQEAIDLSEEKLAAMSSSARSAVAEHMLEDGAKFFVQAAFDAIGARWSAESLRHELLEA